MAIASRGNTMLISASVTRRSGWGLMGHELIDENSSRAWLHDKAGSQNPCILLPLGEVAYPTVLRSHSSMRLQTYGHDKYRRTLADVFLSDGTHVNHTLVKEGWCWWCRKYAPGDTVLEGLEKEAREARKGVWADPQPVPPGAGLFLLPIFSTASTRQIFRPARNT